MNEILSWMAWGFGALLLVALAVAGWEHLMRESRGLRPSGGALGDAARPILTVDVRLDTQAAALAAEPTEQADPSTDRRQRLATMTEALARAANPTRAPHDRSHWLDTTPRVVGLNEPALGQRDLHRQKGDSQPG